MGEIMVMLVLQHPDINRVIKGPFECTLHEKGTIIDVIKFADEEILKKTGTFLVKGYKSLLHMVYHPVES